MTDSIENIREEMLNYAPNDTDDACAQNKEWANRIEALIKEPAVVLRLNEDGSIDRTFIHYLRCGFEVTSGKLIKRTVAKLFALPPDQSKRIAELEKELAEAKHEMEIYKDKWLGQSREKGGQPV